MSSDSDATAAGAPAPVGASDRIAALDVLRGFALLGIFIMNMPGFSHSMFAAPTPTRGAIDLVAATLRDLLFAGKFNLLFGLVFGIGFALQMARLESAESAGHGAAPGRHPAIRIYARRMAFLTVVGLVHAMLLWSGDVLLVYALIGFALLGLRKLGDRALGILVVALLLFPASSEVLRAALFPGGFDPVTAFAYRQFELSNDLAYGHGSLVDAIRETARVFDWSWRSRFGLFMYASFVVQMATGILVGFVVGRRGWPLVPIAPAGAERRVLRLALLLAVGCAIVEPIALLAVGGNTGLFVSTLARTIGRASLAACYAIVVVSYARHRPELPRWLLPLRDVGRMPLTNYLLQTLLASAIFYGWGLGWWNRAGPALETALALLLFVAVQLPLSSVWLARFRHGPLEYVWRLFTYGAPPR